MKMPINDVRETEQLHHIGNWSHISFDVEFQTGRRI